MNKNAEAFWAGFWKMDRVTKTLLWVMAFSFGLWLVFVAGCGYDPAAQSVSDDDGGFLDLLPQQQRPLPPSSGGALPLGYYQRQCQWDACGGPLPLDPNSIKEGGR